MGFLVPLIFTQIETKAEINQGAVYCFLLLDCINHFFKKAQVICQALPVDNGQSFPTHPKGRQKTPDNAKIERSSRRH